MEHLRFSTVVLLRGIVSIALLFGTARALVWNASAWSVSVGGLCFGTLLFSVLFGLSGHSAVRTLLLTLGLYAWGLSCLLLCSVFEPGGVVRIVMAAFGVAYMFWAWLPREPSAAVMADRW